MSKTISCASGENTVVIIDSHYPKPIAVNGRRMTVKEARDLARLLSEATSILDPQ